MCENELGEKLFMELQCTESYIGAPSTTFLERDLNTMVVLFA